MIAGENRPETNRYAYKGYERRTAPELVPMGAAVHPYGVNPT